MIIELSEKAKENFKKLQAALQQAQKDAEQAMNQHKLVIASFQEQQKMFLTGILMNHEYPEGTTFDINENLDLEDTVSLKAAKRANAIANGAVNGAPVEKIIHNGEDQDSVSITNGKARKLEAAK